MGPFSPLFSVLIGTKDRPDAVKHCLASVLSQSCKDVEVLILDDNSREQLSNKIAQELANSRVECIRSDTTLGVAGGRNKLIKKAKGRFLVTLDDDAVLRDDYTLSRLVRLFNSHPDVGLFAFKIVDVVDGREVATRIPFRKAAVKRSPEVADTPQYVSYFLGGGHAARRQIYEKCGLYQEDLIFGIEELDLSYRMLENGYKLFYAPDIVVEHHTKYSSSLSKKTRAEYNYFLARNRIWINYKYLPWFALFVSTAAWCTIRIACSILTGGFFKILRGIWEGFRSLKRLDRTPISRETILYLRHNHGRLFF